MGPEVCCGIARLTKQPKLVPDISSKSIPFVPSRGDASKRCQNTFQIETSNWKDFSSFACVPTAWYKRDGFTENVWYKLRLLSQPSNTRTNIPRHASGPISWLIPKCKQYKLHPPQILYIPRSRLCHEAWQKSPICPQKSPVYICKRALYIRQRALYIHKRALYVRKRALYIRKRVLYIRQRALYIRTRALYTSKRALHIRRIALYVRQRTLYIRKRVLYIRKRALYIHQRALYVHKRRSQMNASH